MRPLSVTGPPCPSRPCTDALLAPSATREPSGRPGIPPSISSGLLAGAGGRHSVTERKGELEAGLFLQTGLEVGGGRCLPQPFRVGVPTNPAPEWTTGPRRPHTTPGAGPGARPSRRPDSPRPAGPRGATSPAPGAAGTPTSTTWTGRGALSRRAAGGRPGSAPRPPTRSGLGPLRARPRRGNGEWPAGHWPTRVEVHQDLGLPRDSRGLPALGRRPSSPASNGPRGTGPQRRRQTPVPAKEGACKPWAQVSVGGRAGAGGRAEAGPGAPRAATRTLWMNFSHGCMTFMCSIARACLGLRPRLEYRLGSATAVSAGGRVLRTRARLRRTSAGGGEGGPGPARTRTRHRGAVPPVSAPRLRPGPNPSPTFHGRAAARVREMEIAPRGPPRVVGAPVGRESART